MELKFFILNLAQQNRVPYTRDVILLNSFENVLTNEIVWVLVLFWKKKKNPDRERGQEFEANISRKFWIVI